MNEQNSDICGSPIAESKKPSAQPSGETRQDDALQPAAAGKADTIASALSPATEKASDPAQNCAQRDKSVVSASFLAGLDLFSEEYDDESEPFIIPSAANGAGHENSVQCEDTVPQAAEPLTLAHELLKAGTVLQSMEDGLPDLMDLDYVPEPDEILLQRYEFEGSMYQEPAQRTEPMRITPEAATNSVKLQAKHLAAPPGNLRLPDLTVQSDAPRLSKECPPVTCTGDRLDRLNCFDMRDRNSAPQRETRNSGIALNAFGSVLRVDRPDQGGRFALDASGRIPQATTLDLDSRFGLNTARTAPREDKPNHNSFHEMDASMPAPRVERSNRDRPFEIAGFNAEPGSETSGSDVRFAVDIPGSEPQHQEAEQGKSPAQLDLTSDSRRIKQEKPDHLDLHTVRQPSGQIKPNSENIFDYERAVRASVMMSMESYSHPYASGTDSGSTVRMPDTDLLKNRGERKRRETVNTICRHRPGKRNSGLSIDNGSLLDWPRASRDAGSLSLKDKERRKKWEL